MYKKTNTFLLAILFKLVNPNYYDTIVMWTALSKLFQITYMHFDNSETHVIFSCCVLANIVQFLASHTRKRKFEIGKNHQTCNLYMIMQMLCLNIKWITSYFFQEKRELSWMFQYIYRLILVKGHNIFDSLFRKVNLHKKEQETSTSGSFNFFFPFFF